MVEQWKTWERSWSKTGKQWEKMSDMEIKTKLSNTKNIWQRFGSNSQK